MKNLSTGVTGGFHNSNGMLIAGSNKEQLFEEYLSGTTARILKQIEDLKIDSSSGVLGQSVVKDSRQRSIDELLYDARADVKILTSKVSMYLSPEFRKNLFNQIDLIHDSEDWEPDESPVTQSSFLSFIRWYLLVSPERAPGLGLSPEGNIIAAWIVNHDKLIIEFLPSDKANWMVTKTLDDEVERGSGKTTIVRLPEVLEPYNTSQFFQKQD